MLLQRKRTFKIFAAVMYPLLLIFMIRLSSFGGGSLFDFADFLAEDVASAPFRLAWSPNTWKVCIIFTLIYVVVWFLIITSLKNTRYGEEHGSAKWVSAGPLGRKLRARWSREDRKQIRKERDEIRDDAKEKKDTVRAERESRLNESSDVAEQKEIKKTCRKSMRELNRELRHQLAADRREKEIMLFQQNMILSDRVCVAMSGMCENINTLILGGAGRLKSRGYMAPNIMQMNSNIVCTDPKGELLKKTGHLLKKNGYDIRVLDLVEHFRSHGYNPFHYFRSDDDILLFVNNMWSSMEDKRATKGEQIWDDQAKNMMMSLCLYLYHFAPKEEQCLANVMLLFNHINDAEEKKTPDPVDRLFAKIPREDTAYNYYAAWSSATGKTLASIRATFSSRMSVFNLDSMKALTYKDEMNLLDLATKKVAIFMVIPDNNSVYNFLAGTLYTQIFQQLYDYADHVCNGPLPQHVRFYMDEFPNVSLPDDYQKILSTSRSRNVSFVIVLQDKQQIEALFEKVYRTLYGNCAWQIFLGSLELETCKYYSELLGKETIHTYTYTKNYGRQSGTSRQEQLVERELMKPDEIRALPKDECIIYTPYYGVVRDKKYDLKKHPLYESISDGNGVPPYLWGEAELAVATVDVLSQDYRGEISPLPELNGVLLGTEEYE